MHVLCLFMKYMHEKRVVHYLSVYGNFIHFFNCLKDNFDKTKTFIILCIEKETRFTFEKYTIYMSVSMHTNALARKRIHKTASTILYILYEV